MREDDVLVDAIFLVEAEEHAEVGALEVSDILAQVNAGWRVLLDDDLIGIGEEVTAHESLVEDGEDHIAICEVPYLSDVQLHKLFGFLEEVFETGFGDLSNIIILNNLFQIFCF